jgi:hypothetical protein
MKKNEPKMRTNKNTQATNHNHNHDHDHSLGKPSQAHPSF